MDVDIIDLQADCAGEQHVDGQLRLVEIYDLVNVHAPEDPWLGRSVISASNVIYKTESSCLWKFHTY